jgi:hypothetical protein
MEILYIGPYRQNDEWGYTSKAFATALSDMNDIDLILRPVYFNHETQSLDTDHLEQYEFKKAKKKDILIQHGLPSALNYNGDFRLNIAITSIDCKINDTDWVQHLNLFDKVVVFSEMEMHLLQESGVTVNIVPFGYPPLFHNFQKHDLNLQFTQKTKFYTEGSLATNSGTREIIIAYLSKFYILDDVLLVIATSQPKELEEEIKKIKQKLGIYVNDDLYPNIAIINNNSLQVMNYLHEYCDVFIAVGYNMRISQQVLKAMLFNSIPITLQSSGFMEGRVVTGSNQQILYSDRPITRLYSGRDTWYVPDTGSLSKELYQTYLDLKDPDYLKQAYKRMYEFKKKMPKVIKSRIRLCLQ